MASPMTPVDNEEEKPKQQVTPSVQKKRKRAGESFTLSAEEKSSKIEAMSKELKGLFHFCKEINGNEECHKFSDEKFTGTLDSAIAVLLEESMLPLTELVNVIFDKVKDQIGSRIEGDGSGVGSLVSVRNRVLLIGERKFYGVLNAEVDMLEDDGDSTLWCWETKDFKLLPKSLHQMLKARRACRDRIKARIGALSEMIAALESPEDSLNCQQELAKAPAKVSISLSEEDIRSIFKTMDVNTTSELTGKGQKHERLSLKQLEKSKRQEQKERRKMECEQQKEDLRKEKKLKRLHDEAEKERKRDKAEKDRKRKEKEVAELRKQRALMDRFFKKAMINSAAENDRPPSDDKCDSSPMSKKQIPSSVIESMDCALSMDTEMKAEDIRKLHQNSWRSLGHSLRLRKNMHWGIRWKPKTELVKELKLTTNRELAHNDDTSNEVVGDGWVDSSIDSSLYQARTFRPVPRSQKHVKNKQLLQFDKSYRPAFYGIWPKTSRVVKPRHPFVKDPELDYEVDSDEESEEEESGESLSVCDKDDGGDSSEEACSKDHAGDDDSEDSFIVPDGYHSQNEGVDVDIVSSKPSAEELSTPSEELSQWFRQQKHLYDVTELALKKDQPLVISNFKHEKASFVLSYNLTGLEKHDLKCLRALGICAFPSSPPVEISFAADGGKEGQEACSSNTNITTTAGGAAILEPDLAQMVSVIQSCPHGMNKLVESLHDKFPSTSKSQLKNRVREIAEFSDNRWQVKQEIMEMLVASSAPPQQGSSSQNHQ